MRGEVKKERKGTTQGDWWGEGDKGIIYLQHLGVCVHAYASVCTSVCKRETLKQRGTI